MKSLRFQKKLREKLPYAKLTPKANARFDEILRRLPEREELTEIAKPESDTEKKGHRYRDSDKVSDNTGVIIDFEEAPRRSWPGIAVRAAFSLAALVLVFLVSLNVLRPDLAESLPGMGGVFQTWNQAIRPRREVSQPVESESDFTEQRARLSVDSAFIYNGNLILSLSLYTDDSELSSASWFSNRWSEAGTYAEAPVRVTYGGQSLKISGEAFFGASGDHYKCSVTVENFPETDMVVGGTLVIDALYGAIEERGSEAGRAPDIKLGSLKVDFNIGDLEKEEDPIPFAHNIVSGLSEITLFMPQLKNKMYSDPPPMEFQLWAGENMIVNCPLGHYDGNTMWFTWYDDALFSLGFLLDDSHAKYTLVILGGSGPQSAIKAYDINLERQSVVDADSIPQGLIDSGVQTMPLSEFAALYNTGLGGHMNFRMESANYYEHGNDGSGRTEQGSNQQPLLRFGVNSDVDSDLPAVAVVWIGDTEYIHVPLYYREQFALPVEPEQLYHIGTDNYDMAVYQTDNGEGDTSDGVQVREDRAVGRNYDVIVYFPDISPELLREADMRVEIRDERQQEVIDSSNVVKS